MDKTPKVQLNKPSSSEQFNINDFNQNADILDAALSDMYTKEDVHNIVNTALADFWKTIYPVGSIYTSINNVNPSTFWGGTWESIGSGRVLWGADSTHSAGTTINAGLPNITASVSCEREGLFNGRGSIYTSGAFSTSGSTSYCGGDNGDGGRPTGLNFNANNSNSIYGNSSTVQPPAYCVYFWKRTA